jgi:hypothetical protein
MTANETTNETAAESGRLTLANSTAEILLGLTRGELARKAGHAASRRQPASGHAERRPHTSDRSFAENARRAACTLVGARKCRLRRAEWVVRVAAAAVWWSWSSGGLALGQCTGRMSVLVT